MAGLNSQLSQVTITADLDKKLPMDFHGKF